MASGSATPTSESPSSTNKRRKIHDSSTMSEDIEQHGEPPDSGPRDCGICFLEEGHAARGFIDSCDHVFCFVCIMEWSKVESRCPLCKRRFASIKRPPKIGVFPSERLVHVPVRNQAYHPRGIISVTQDVDPYTQTMCSVCKSGENECLLLLCDLCDCASHSYCVGLGYAVPEGDWFCDDCTLSKADHATNETDVASSEDISKKLKIVPPNSGDVSVSDIVHEARVRRPNRAELSREESGARTLQRCRNVHRQIGVMRQNWNSLQRGSMVFSSSTEADSGFQAGESQNRVSLPVSDNPPSQHKSSSSVATQATRQNVTGREYTQQASSTDIDKAWKMMRIALSTQQRVDAKNVKGEASKSVPFVQNRPGEAKSIIQASKIKGVKICGSRGIPMERHHKYHALHHNRPGGIPEVSKQYPNKRIMKGCSVITEKSHNCHRAETFQIHCSGKADFQASTISTERRRVDQPGSSSTNIFHSNRIAMLNSSSGSLPLVPGLSLAERLEPHKGKEVEEHDPVKSTDESKNHPKSEIQSLVKLNLKLLTAKQRLEVYAFKEVARCATHTILAACGLERPRPDMYFIPSSTCCHLEESCKSTLMPNSCRQCFYVFVKDIVSSIISEKLQTK